MAELLIRYKDSAGNVSERRISKIEPQELGYVLAFCHERHEDRTFKISRIISAVNAETGEIIDDLHAYFGIDPASKHSPPEPQPIPVGTEAVKRLRNQERRTLFKPFVLSVIEERAKNSFFAFFGDACFKCGSPGPLVIDHHVPIVLGGHLVPGNLVALCERCNNRKSDAPPERFYTKAELERLQEFLDGQHRVFEFVFDHKAWEVDRKSYLLALGIDADLVREVLNNPDHRFYVPPRDDSDGISVTITIDDESILKIVQKRTKGSRLELNSRIEFVSVGALLTTASRTGLPLLEA